MFLDHRVQAVNFVDKTAHRAVFKVG